MAQQQPFQGSHNQLQALDGRRQGRACWQPLFSNALAAPVTRAVGGNDRAPWQGLLTCVALGLRPRGEGGGGTPPRCGSLSSLTWRTPPATQPAMSSRASAPSVQLGAHLPVVAGNRLRMRQKEKVSDEANRVWRQMRTARTPASCSSC